MGGGGGERGVTSENSRISMSPVAQLPRTSERCKLLDGNSHHGCKSNRRGVYLRRRKYSRGNKFPFTMPRAAVSKKLRPPVYTSLKRRVSWRARAVVSLYRKITRSVENTVGLSNIPIYHRNHSDAH